MNFLLKGFSALTKLAAVAVMVLSFFVGMASVVYMSLSGKEVTVPNIIGKDFVESERELAALGIKLKKRADRPSSEKINTVLEQLPHAGETVKSGQLILVVVSSAGLEEEATPKSLIKDIESDDSETIGEMLSDKPKRANSNSNSNSSRKKADTKRDVIANTEATPANITAIPDVTPKQENSVRKEPTEAPADNGEKNRPSSTPRPQQTQPPSGNKAADGDSRPRTVKKP